MPKMTKRRLSKIEEWAKEQRRQGESGQHLDFIDECAAAIRRLIKQAEPKIGANDPAFLAFWDEWPVHPRKLDKARCAEVFSKLGPDDKKECIKGVRSARGSSFWTKDNGQYIPSPLRWVQERRWEGFTGPTTTGVSKLQWLAQQHAVLRQLQKDGKYEEAYALDVRLRDHDKYWEEERARICDESLQ